MNLWIIKKKNSINTKFKEHFKIDGKYNLIVKLSNY